MVPAHRLRAFAASCIGLVAWLAASVSPLAAAPYASPPDFSSLIDLNEPPPSFRKGGRFRIAGGVVLEGRALFYVGRNDDWRPASSAAVALAIHPDGQAVLRYQRASYRLSAPEGSICALSKFLLRDGSIAFTVPPEDDPEGLQAAGLVNDMAPEFDTPLLARLVEAADFAPTTSISEELEQRILERANAEHGGNRPTSKRGSYVNTDEQIVYKVYLDQGLSEVRVSGVPLRYYWRYDLTNPPLPVVTRVKALAYDLSSLPPPVAERQGQIIAFYQAGGVLRQLMLNQRKEFESVVRGAC